MEDTGRNPAVGEDRDRPDQEDSPAEGEKDIQQVCDLCGMQYDRLAVVRMNTRKGWKTKNVCGECLWAMRIRNGSLVPVFGPLFSETEEEKKARAGRISELRRKGGVIQENLFLEDITSEVTVRQIVKVWEIYEFGELYPGIGRSLYHYLAQEKQTIGGLPESLVYSMKRELADLLAVR